MAKRSTIIYLTSASAASLIVLGLALNFATVVTDYWISAGPSGNFGLWRLCDFTHGDCLTIWLVAARGLTVLAGIMGMVALTIVVVILSAVVKSPKLPIAAVIFAIIAAFFLGGGLIAWVGGIEGEFRPVAGFSFNYGWSFGLGWASLAMYLLAAVTIGFQMYAITRLGRRQPTPPYNVLQDVPTM